MEVVKVAATFASTVASTAVSASRVLRIPASTVAGTSAVGRDAVCVSAGGGASPEQATAVSPEITRTIRMIILIFFPQCRENFQSSLSTGSAPPALTEANSPAGGLARPDQDAPVSPCASSPFPSIRGESQNEGLASAMPAAKGQASALGTGLRCRNPRGHRQLHTHPSPRFSSRRCPCSLWATAARLNCFNWGCPESHGPTLKRP